MPKRSRPLLRRLTDANDGIRTGVAVVTGCGSGLGHALAIEMASRGIQVVGFSRSAASFQSAGDLVASGRLVPMVVDVADDDAVKSAFARIRAEIGDVTILVNNASVHSQLDFLQETPTSFMKSVETNLGGAVACTYSALQCMVETGIGRILNVGTLVDTTPRPGASAFSVSTGATRMLTLALVADLADRFPNIVISHWVPGLLATAMGHSVGLDPAVAACWGANLALWHDRSLNGATFDRDAEILPIQRWKSRVWDRLRLRGAPTPRRLDADHGARLAYASETLGAV